MKEAIPTGRRLAADFPTDPHKFMRNLAVLQSYRKLFLMSYNGLIQTGEIEPIEKLPIETKKDLMQFCNQIEVSAGLSFDNSMKIEICRCLWALEYFENEPK